MAHPIFQAFYRPFIFSDWRNYYRDVELFQNGVGFLSLGLAAMVQVIALSVMLVVLWTHGNVSTYVDQVINQTPTVTFTNGHASIDRPSPYFITLTIPDKKTGRRVYPVAAFDTTSKFGSTEDMRAWIMKHDVFMLVMRDGVATYDRHKDEFKLRGFGARSNFVLNAATVRGWAHTAMTVGTPIIFIVCVLGLWVYLIVQALLFSLAGLAMNALLKTRQDYAAILRYSSIALAPITLLAALMGLLHSHMPALVFIALVLALQFTAFEAVKTRPAPARNPFRT